MTWEDVGPVALKAHTVCDAPRFRGCSSLAGAIVLKRHLNQGRLPWPSSETAHPAESRIEFPPNISPTLESAAHARPHCLPLPIPLRLARKSSTKLCATAKFLSW